MRTRLKRVAFLVLFSLGAILVLGRAHALGLEVVAEFAMDTPPGNVAVTPDGRMFMSLHQFYGSRHRVVEVLAGNQVKPFPDRAWSAPPTGDGRGLSMVLGLAADRDGMLWMLDNPARPGEAGRLIAWDAGTNQLRRVIYLAPPVVPENTFLSDLAVDTDNQAVYIADTAGGDNAALVVVDLKTGRARRVLQGTFATRPEDVDMVINDRRIERNGQPVRIGVNPIAVDPGNEWVYFGPMSGTNLYRVRTRDLLDETPPPPALLAKVERYGEKPISGGIVVDGGGNVYVSDVTANAIGVVEPGGRYRVLFQDNQMLSWPVGLALGGDNKIYVTVSQLHRSPFLNGGTNAAKLPFRLLRFDALPLVTGGK